MMRKLDVYDRLITNATAKQFLCLFRAHVSWLSKDVFVQGVGSGSFFVAHIARIIGASTFVFVNENLATVGGEKWTIQISKLWKISKLKMLFKSRQQLLLPFQAPCHRTPLLWLQGPVRNSSC